MKKLLLTTLLTMSALSTISSASMNTVEWTSISKNADMEKSRLCKVFTKKIASYESNMREDTYATHTLNSYKKRATEYCLK